MRNKLRILIGKVGLDGHDVGARVVARALADAGMEVIYTGIRQTAEQNVNAAIEEGADIIGISILSGSHMVFIPKIIELLKLHNAVDIKVIVGGIIPPDDANALRMLGVKEVFVSGTPTARIVQYIKNMVEDN